MKKMKQVLSKPFSYFMNLKLFYKLILGYVFIILIPTITLEAVLYVQNSKLVIERYYLTQQHALTAAVDNLNTQCQQIESVGELFQSSSSVQNYLYGGNDSLSDEIYTYIKDIHPLFSFCKNSNSHINNITLYKYNNTALDLNTDIVNIKYFTGDMKSIDSLRGNKGLWQLAGTKNNNTTAITYYQKIFDQSYTDNLGFMQVIAKPEDFFNVFSSLPEMLYIQTKDGFLYKFNGNNLVLVSGNEISQFKRNKVIQKLKLDKFDAMIYYVFNTNKNNVKENKIFIFLVLTILFIFLSILYYAIAVSVSERIIKLKHHIEKSSADALKPYFTKDYKDEIGTLVITYNEMIEKINNLINKVYLFELQKKEANFYALQAQIQPHFLYNALENIRMSAEAHEDQETSQLVYALGKYMRYNLAGGNQAVSLFKEIEHVKSYLDVFKMRLKALLEFKITIFTEIDQISCPKFILQPIVENSIKHGFVKGKMGTIKITVLDSSEPEYVLVKIEDDGVGISEQDLNNLNQILYNSTVDVIKSEEHVGLKNVYDRLLSFYDDNGVLTINSKPGHGTTVTLRIKAIAAN